MSDVIRVERYSQQLLENELGGSNQARYLYDYLSDIGAKTVLYESEYVDRHYLDDFVTYYAKSFRAPESHCARMHFFAVNKKELSQTIDNAFDNKDLRGEAERKLSEGYLGFVVVRPLVGAQVGRTVLKTYPPENHRRYEVVRPYRVSVAGLVLEIEGLAFQQQDQGTAACASMAMWSALQRVSHVSGHRTPTPSEITKAANSPFPASFGLYDHQMADALSRLGYSADMFVPADNRIQFRAKIVACLQSQLPVILLLLKKQKTTMGDLLVGHALTVTGFREPESVVEVPASVEGVKPLRMRSGSLEVLYVHDDNLGSHAHYEVFDSDDKDDPNEMYVPIKLRRGRKRGKNSDWWEVDEWTIASALVPKNDKMRLPIEDLFSNVFHLRKAISVALQSHDLDYGVRLSSGVAYKRSLWSRGFNSADLKRFLFAASFPRHIRLVSVFQRGKLLLELILDTTEVDRGTPSVIGIVAPGVPDRSIAWLGLRDLARELDCLLISAPPST